MSATPDTDVAPDGRTERGPLFGLHALTALVVIVGLVVAGVLTVVSHLNYLHTEQRLTALQTSLTASALRAAPATLEDRLGVAATAAQESRSPVTAFRAAMASSLGAKGPFVTAALARVSNGKATIVVHLGGKAVLSEQGATLQHFLLAAARTGALQTIQIVGDGVQRFGFALASHAGNDVYVAAAGESLPAKRHVTLPASSPLASLDFALYFGDTTNAAHLVETNATALPLTGTTARAVVPFGGADLTLVLAPHASLAGAWAEAIPWVILAAIVVFAAAIAVMTEGLMRRRERAELLAIENRRLFQEQRGVAQVLQRSLLPQRLPAREQLEIAVRYSPGVAGIDVGGDWYDVVELGDGTLFFSVGDVAGRGLEAAALMSMLRNATRAFASEGVGPAEVLGRLARMVDIEREGRFATVLCGRVDPSDGRVEVASAGHLPPLLVERGVARLLVVPVGPPVGIDRARYEVTAFVLGVDATLLGYTDGLVERRGEALDEGLARLAARASGEKPLEACLDDLLAALAPDGAPDDVAILALRRRDPTRAGRSDVAPHGARA